MIEIDGIKIPKVTSIKLNDETGFMAFVDFLVDSRIEDCVSLEDLEPYNPFQVVEETKDQIGVYRIILSNETDISFST